MSVISLLKQNRSTYIPFITIFFIVSSIITYPVHAFDVTQVSIDPSNQSVSPGGSFTVDVYCIPGQPIKSFEFKLSFNPSLLRVNTVTEGTIFEGYTTFFNDGIIDNTAGTISHVYNLILGEGQVSSPGTFVTITFTAKITIGTSDINLLEVGVTDDSGYLSIDVTSGSVSVQTTNNPPVFSSVSPSNGTTNVSITRTSLNITIRDPDGDRFNYTIQTRPNIGSVSVQEASNGTKTCTISGLQYSTTYRWYINATDGKSWTRRWYRFTTTTAPSGGENPPPGGGGTPDGGDSGQQNNPPNAPSIPSGPSLIEQSIEYMYTSSSYDPDGDTVRLRFDWGDNTFSDWSDFTTSNTSVSLTHSWNSVSSFQIRAIAQDEDGLNSSWSSPFTVTVSQINGSEEPPVLNIQTSPNMTNNQIVTFDASGSNIPNGVIVSYYWDFGDGETSTEINPDHTYKTAGTYTVTLTITDNLGNTYSKSMTLSVESSASGTPQEQDLAPFPIILIVIGIATAFLLFFIIFFRDNIRIFLSKKSIAYEEQKIDRLDKEIEELNLSLIQTAKTPPVKKEQVTKKMNIETSSDVESIEKKVDEAIFLKTKEKPDNNEF